MRGSGGAGGVGAAAAWLPSPLGGACCCCCCCARRCLLLAATTHSQLHTPQFGGFLSVFLLFGDPFRTVLLPAYCWGVRGPVVCEIIKGRR